MEIGAEHPDDEIVVVTGKPVAVETDIVGRPGFPNVRPTPPCSARMECCSFSSSCSKAPDLRNGYQSAHGRSAEHTRSRGRVMSFREIRFPAHGVGTAEHRV